MYLDNITASADGVWGAAFYSDTQPSVDAPWNPGVGQSVAQFEIPDTVAAGDLVTVSGDVSGTVVVKDHVITELALTGVDVDTDVVSGTAAEGTSVGVNIHGLSDPEIEAIADSYNAGSGLWEWTAAFAAGQIDPDTQGYAVQRDDDGDQTQIQWPTPPPANHFAVDPMNDQVVGWSWPIPGAVTVEIFDVGSDGSGSPLRSWSDITVNPDDPGDPRQPVWEFLAESGGGGGAVRSATWHVRASVG